jgi:hypothetical protein
MKQKIIDGNIKIAQFDELTKDTYGKFFKNGVFKGYNESEFQYHKSWDWLIPVLKKIAEKDDIFRAGVASIMSKYNYDIEQVWEATVKHIELSSVSA